MSSDAGIHETKPLRADEDWRRHETYVSATMEFRCNLACNHCMIEGTMDWLKPQSAEQFDELLARNARERRYQGLILTGSEITLNKNLVGMAQRAKAAGFAHIRIQTHGMHLANPDFCARLVEAGIDEYFVSVTAGDRDTHDTIAQVPGSFDRILQGLRNLEHHDVVVITNTVVTQQSYRSLPALVELLAPFRRLRQMEFWNYFPMATEDTKDLIVPYPDLMPVLNAAIDRAQALGRFVEVKNVPECLLGKRRDVLVNDQPELMIDPRFWDGFAQNEFLRCPYLPGCTSRKCLALTTAYVKKFGWEAEILSAFA